MCIGKAFRHQHQEPCQSIVELNKICPNNVVTQYGDQIYTKLNGVITSDDHSVSLETLWGTTLYNRLLVG